MKLATIAYLPPKRIAEGIAFKQNLDANPTKYPLVLFADDEDWGCEWRCDDVEKAKTRQWFTLSNAVFLNALWIARQMELDYFLYVEADSRVRGKHWDERMFEDHFGMGENIVTSGSLVCWNSHANGRQTLIEFTEFAHAYLKRIGIPMVIYGSVLPHQMVGLTVYANGSVAIYHVPTLAKIFSGFENNPIGYALRMTAWDLQLGVGLWKMFGADIFKHVGGLKTAYSGCGDSMFTLEERKQMLISGEKVAVHQAKTTDPWL